MQRFATVYLLFFLLFGASGCQRSQEKSALLFNFESDSSLDHVNWKCRTLFHRSTEHTTQGEFSLRLQLFPSAYPGFNPEISIKDWSAYTHFSFDVWNDEKYEVPLTVRIDDRKSNPSFADRYNKTFLLLPGMNYIEISLHDLMTSDTRRPMDLSSIEQLIIFIATPQSPVTLFLDHGRLKNMPAKGIRPKARSDLTGSDQASR